MNTFSMLNWATACVTGFETIAIFSKGRIPTISTLCRRHKVLGPTLLGALAIHLYWPIKRVVEEATDILVEVIEGGA